MKSSDVLKEALRLFVENRHGNCLGCCDAINFAAHDMMGGGLNNYHDRVDAARLATNYVKNYRPEHFSLYWWPIGDRATRIDVLNKCIADAIEAGD